jgi:Tol biopolymer transport system component
VSRRSRRLLLAGCAAAGLLLSLTTTEAAPLPLPSGTVVRVNVGPGNAEAPNTGYTSADVYYPAISATGRYVVFTSANPGLVHVAPRCKSTEFFLTASQIYRRDLTRGITELVSVRPDGCPSRGGGVDGNSVSADGRYVAFFSAAPDLVRGITPPPGQETVFLRDMVRGRTSAVSVSYDGRHANNNTAGLSPQTVSISADGRYVAFDSFASNLVPHDARPRGEDISEVYVRDMRTHHTERIGPLNHEVVYATAPSISGNGRYVAFTSVNQDLAGKPDYGFLAPGFLDAGPQQVYLYDRVTHRVDMASRSDSGITSFAWSTLSPSGHALSDDGRYLVFGSQSNNLVPGDDSVPTGLGWDPSFDIYLYDRVAHHLSRISQSTEGLPADYTSEWPSISANGRWIAYDSGANNLGPVDLTYPLPTSPVEYGYDVYLHDRVSGANTLLSHADSGVQGDLSSTNAVVSGDGKAVAFISSANNLVVPDTNAQPDVFAWRSP